MGDNKNFEDDQLDEILKKYAGDEYNANGFRRESYNDRPASKSKTESKDGNSSGERKINRRVVTTKQAEMRKKARKSNMILNILLVIFILTFLGSGTYLGLYYYRVNKAEKQFSNLKNLVEEDGGSPDSIVSAVSDASNTDAGTAPSLTYEDINGVQVQTKFAKLYKMNSDFIGWLNIPGTNIDYPVMQTPSDEEYYLRRDFNKEESASGTLFLSQLSDIYKPTDNIIIYGHNMKAGTMLSAILDYETEDFYKEHKTFTFDTIQDNGTYEVIGSFRTEIDEENSSFFAYYEFIDAGSEEEFNEYVSKVKSLTPYKTNDDVKYGDKLITLSTCAYHATEGRYVLVGKKID